jgi:hypothetical protein
MTPYGAHRGDPKHLEAWSDALSRTPRAGLPTSYLATVKVPAGAGRTPDLMITVVGDEYQGAVSTIVARTLFRKSCTELTFSAHKNIRTMLYSVDSLAQKHPLTTFR